MEDQIQTQTEEVSQAAQPKKTTKKILIAVLAAFFILIIAAGLYLAYGPSSNFKNKILGKIPYPITMVGGKPIYYNQIERRLEVAEKNNKGAEKVDSNELKSKIVDNLIEERKLELAANKFGVTTSNQQVTELFDKTVETAAAGDKQKFQNLLTDFGLTADEFKNDILKPQAMFTNMVVWFNSNKEINKDSYQKLDQISQKLTSGESFESLVAQYSEDESSKETEGDMGNVDINQVIPEIASLVKPMNVGETKVVPSRYGIHYLKLESKDDASHLYHIKQIFVKPTTDFKTWYDDQAKQFKVTHVVKNF